jgi:hypothetical protein
VSKSTILNRVPGTGRPTNTGCDLRSMSSSCMPRVKQSTVWVSVMP